MACGPKNDNMTDLLDAVSYSMDEGIEILAARQRQNRDKRHRNDVLVTLHNALGVMYENEELTDLEVKVEDKTFKCHKVIMAALSGYFRSLMTSGMQESQGDELELRNIQEWAFESILRYMYHGENVIRGSNVEELLKTSVFLQVKSLERECVEFMSQSLSPLNCIAVWRTGREIGCPELADKAWLIILKNFNEVSQQEEFTSLDKDDLLTILNNDDLSSDSEDPICDAVLEWVRADPTSREEHLEDLMLGCVCFPKLSGSFLFDRFMSDKKLMDRNLKLREKVMEAVEFHLKPDQEQRKLNIIAKQSKLREDPSLQKVVTLLGGYYLADDPLKCVLCFDLKRNKWFTVACISHDPGEDFATCVYQNEIYLSGGSRSLDNFVKYSPMSNDWLKQPSLITGRECHTMAVLGDVIYVIGGRNSQQEQGSEIVEDIEAYNVKRGTWGVVGKLQSPLESPSSAVLNEKIYLFGGLDEDQEPSKVIQCFDPSTESCSIAGNFPEPVEMSAAMSINNSIYILSSGGKVYKFGSSGSEFSVSKIADFDPRSKFGVYQDGHSIVVVGGEKAGGELVDDILKIDVRSGKVIPGDAKLPIPYGGFRMECLVVQKSILQQEGFNVQGQVLFDPEFEFLEQGNFEKKFPRTRNLD